MSDTYKIRMTVLVMMGGYDPDIAKLEAREMAEEAGFSVLNVEEPDLVETKFVSGSLEGDIYP